MVIEKTSSFLHSNGFTVLSKDPTTTYHNKLKLAIKNLHPNFIEQFNINPSHFIPSNPLPPRLYCLPKIHKPEIPYRPIVSSVGSNTHHLSVFLSKQLPSILEFKPNFSIKNSIMLCNELSGVSIPDSSILFSFDVVNLFNNIPPTDCLQIFKNLLHSSNTSDIIAGQLLE